MPQAGHRENICPFPLAVGSMVCVTLPFRSCTFDASITAFTANAFVVGASFAVTGVFVVVWNVITVSLRQRIVPDHLLGRVNAGYRLFAWGTQPIGALLGGLVAQFIGLQTVFILAGVMSLALLFARLTLDEPALRRAEEAGERPTAVPAGA